MAGRPTKQGIDYFPFDVGFFEDIKVRKISRACGSQSTSILICLLCNIYRNDGYYILWDEDLPFVIADTVGVSEGAVKEVILKAIQVEFFSKEKYDSYKILTSHGIQKRFFQITYQRKETEIMDDFLINHANNSINHANNPINNIDNGQSKVKEKGKEKGKESKVNNNPHNPLTGVDGNSDENKEIKSEKIDYEAFMHYFNKTFSGKLPSIREMSDPRKKSVKRCISDYGKERVIEAYSKILSSPFLLGKNSEWRCDFDWIFKPKNFLKILEGTYNERNNTLKPAVGNSVAEQRKGSVDVLFDLAGKILQEASGEKF